MDLSTAVYYNSAGEMFLSREVRPGDRYSLTAEITLDRDGNRLGTKIFKSLIRSRVRGVYSEVNDILEKRESSPFAEKYAEVLPMLFEMEKLYHILAERAREHGSLELDDCEAVILLDENGEPADIVPAVRGDGEKLIEQFMLQANMGVAETMLALELPCLYRVHAKPGDDKLRAFTAFISGLGLNTYGIVRDGEGGEEGSGRTMPSQELARRLDRILVLVCTVKMAVLTKKLSDM